MHGLLDMDCDYKILDTSEDGEYAMNCRRCGHQMKSRYPPNLVHTRCGNSTPPTASEVIELVRSDLAKRDFDELPGTLPEIARRVVICHRNACGKFNGRLCTDRGGICTHWARWIERLAVGVCAEWKTTSTSAAGPDQRPRGTRDA